MRRSWALLDEKERRGSWRAAVAGLAIVPTMALTLVLVARYGPQASSAIMLIAPGVAILRRTMRPSRFLVGPDVRVPVREAAANAS
jgi:hypothetical protein